MPLEQPDQLNLEVLEKDLPRDQDRYFAGRLISQVQSELFAKKRRIANILSKWTVAYDYLKIRHFDLLSTQNPLTSEVKHFYATVSILKGLGDLLIVQLQHHSEIDIQTLFGVSVHDIDACVQELGDIERAYRSDMTKETEDDISQSVFSDTID